MGKWDDAISFYYLCSEDKRHHFHYPLLDRTVIGGGNTDPSSMWEECQPLYKKSIWDKIGSTLKNTSYHHQYQNAIVCLTSVDFWRKDELLGSLNLQLFSAVILVSQSCISSIYKAICQKYYKNILYQDSDSAFTDLII